MDRHLEAATTTVDKNLAATNTRQTVEAIASATTTTTTTVLDMETNNSKEVVAIDTKSIPL